ncbi:hypothetical protein EB796_023101 [Bugula neritina]|uniref:Uncharacterized protein n=2 Tax=Bugula neritina TaxID=10212 RepID=A0A7J7IXF5_BUGNE|nr:hypothetical protein EB796_023101 [Bugula neritina]
MERIKEESKDCVTCPICMEIFDDPRTLQCSHTFCFHCLIELRGSHDSSEYKLCPTCRRDSVPPLNQIERLPKNDFALSLASLIHDYEKTDTESVGDTNEVIYHGPKLKEQEDEKTGLGMGLSVVAGLAVTALTGGFGGIVAGLAVAGGGILGCAEAKNKRKRSYFCNGCNKTSSSIDRFKCGMCDDFTLCPSCHGQSQLHNAQHLFLKLKQQPQRQLPTGPILKPQANDIAKSLNFGQKVHGKAYVHSPEKIIALSGIKCKFCGSAPIKGIRFKCGMCKDYDLCSQCEPGSQNIHKKDHVFIALKNQADINIISEPLCRAYFY